MTKCSEIPKFREGNRTCELDIESYNARKALNDSKLANECINWNQYYKFCNVSDKNPFAGSISFDNIGLAWVVIFQVRLRSRPFLSVPSFRSFSDHQSRELGEYHVLYPRCSFLLGLDLFRVSHCHWLVFHDQSVSRCYCYSIQ